MKVYLIIEKYDNGEEYESKYSHSSPFKVFYSREKAIEFIKDIKDFCNLDEDETEDVKEISNDTFVDGWSNEEETIRTVSVTVTERYIDSFGVKQEYERTSITYQYAIKEMEVQ